MRPSVLKVVLRLVATAGIPGIIVGSIAENDAVAITFGSMTAVSAFGLILVTAATTTPTTDAVGDAVETGISRLVAAGADEHDVRALVGDAVRLGQQQRSS